jgi:hypothetical protein
LLLEAAKRLYRGPTLPEWTEEERTRAAWGEALGLDPNGAPYDLADLEAETERVAGAQDRLDTLLKALERELSIPWPQVALRSTWARLTAAYKTAHRNG